MQVCSRKLTLGVAAPAPSAYDPFSVSGDAHTLMGGAPPDTRPTGDIDAWYRKLCTSSSGVLYEDSNLQVRPKHICPLITSVAPAVMLPLMCQSPLKHDYLMCGEGVLALLVLCFFWH